MSSCRACCGEAHPASCWIWRGLRGYAALARTVAAPLIARTVPADADDDAVIACALAAKASLIVTGDHDLLVLHPFRDIAILNPTTALQRIQTDAD